MRCIHAEEFHLALKRNEIMMIVEKWLELGRKKTDFEHSNGILPVIYAPSSECLYVYVSGRSVKPGRIEGGERGIQEAEKDTEAQAT